jgi:hypothetical protein
MTTLPKRPIAEPVVRPDPVVRAESVIRAMPAARVTEQNSQGLRRALFESLDALRNGKTTPMVANATSRLAEQIIRSVELEMGIERLAQQLGKRGDRLINILPQTVPLGNREDAADMDVGQAFQVEHENKDDET